MAQPPRRRQSSLAITKSATAKMAANTAVALVRFRRSPGRESGGLVGSFLSRPNSASRARRYLSRKPPQGPIQLQRNDALNADKALYQSASSNADPGLIWNRTISRLIAAKAE
jgi:hypothetical protein